MGSLNPLDPENLRALSRAIEAREEARRQADPAVQADVRATIKRHEAAKKAPDQTTPSPEDAPSNPLTGLDDHHPKGGGALYT